MGKQLTELLKGTLEGIVLAILGERPAYGYEITARLREQGFADIAEGTVYAVLVRVEQRGLVDVEKVPSEKGPPRKVYSLNGDGRDYLDEFWRTWSFLAGRLDQLRDGEDRQWHATGSSWSPDRSSRRSSTGRRRRASTRCPSRT
jgi:PadR family transcriptional regulator PadR